MEDSIYKEIILDLYRNPLNKKALVDFDIKQSGVNPSCGDEIDLMIKFDVQRRLVDIGHQGQGCAISQAAVSLLTEEVKGKTHEEILTMADDEMITILHIPISYTRFQCATLGLKTLQRALQGVTSSIIKA